MDEEGRGGGYRWTLLNKHRFNAPTPTVQRETFQGFFFDGRQLGNFFLVAKSVIFFIKNIL